MPEKSAVKTDQVSDHASPKEQVFDHDTIDYFLQSLVRLADNGIEIGVTLTVSGFLVSGTIVGGKRYFDEHLVSGLAKNTKEILREEMTKFFNNFGKIYDPTPGNSGEEITTFIHLRDARFFHHAGKPIPANRTIWWRGRLSEIQGFSMGNLTHEA